MMVTFPRRELLKGGAAAAVLAALAHLLPACRQRDAPASGGCGPAGEGALSPREHAILEAFADRIVPPGGAIAAGAQATGVARAIDRHLACHELPALVNQFRGALWLIELSGVLTGRLRRFTAMSLPERDGYLLGLCRSRLALRRRAFAGLKQACLFAFYSTPEAWSGIGYPGPLLDRATRGAGA
ncbi:MAG: gluconate 2-dehydrogenase subunit 3 family protein [Candidatus Schekmanbacteria bacterium]|nr:gluconate 2-dehydrogenase subunit 3 family protein [Candidatus Schekmanbacteria bacterium]